MSAKSKHRSADTPTDVALDSLFVAYLKLRESGHLLEAKSLWNEYRLQQESENLIRQYFHSNVETEWRHAFRRLTEVHGEKALDILGRAGISLGAPEGGALARALLSEQPVNYRGYVCLRVVSIRPGGANPAWDSVRKAFVVKEGAAFAVEAWLQAEAPRDRDAVKSEEVYITGGTDCALVPFQLGIDGYPLRIDSPKTSTKTSVLRDGEGDRVRFTVNPKSVLAGRNGEQRYAIWVHCRQHGGLIQNVGVNVVVVAATRAAVARKTVGGKRPAAAKPKRKTSR